MTKKAPPHSATLLRTDWENLIRPDQKLWSYQDNLGDASDQLTTEFSNGQTLFYNRYFLSSDNYNIAGKLEFLKKIKEEEYGYKHEFRVGADANVEEIDFFNRFVSGRAF